MPTKPDRDGKIIIVSIEEAPLIDQFLAIRSADLREQIIVQSMPFVGYTLHRLGITQNLVSDYEDLVQQGLLGLMDAVDRFAPNHGAQFQTYANVRIRGKILDYLRAADWMSRSARHRARIIRKAISDLWNQLHREPGAAEIAQYLGINPTQVQRDLAEMQLTFVSIDAIREIDHEGDCDLHEWLGDAAQPNPQESLENQDLQNDLIHNIQGLPEREQRILSMYYVDELTFHEIGQILNLTESRVCQLHTRAILNLKRMVKKT